VAHYFYQTRDVGFATIAAICPIQAISNRSICENGSILIRSARADVVGTLHRFTVFIRTNPTRLAAARALAGEDQFQELADGIGQKP
jgi:hypothetical protein